MLIRDHKQLADLADVTQTIATLTSQAVYPNGTSQPSVAGVTVSVFPGWPIRNELDQILQEGNAAVAIFPTNKVKYVTKFERIFQSLQQTPPTLTATIIDSGGTGTATITIGGTIAVPQAVVVTVNKVVYGYQVLISDTLDTIADGIADLIPGATALGPVITIPGVINLTSYVSSPYAASEEIARQERIFMISIWAPTPDIRASLEAAIDVFFKLNYRIVLSDNYYAQVFPETDPGFNDMLEKSLIYRRDLHYRIQYATTVTENFMTIAALPENVDIVQGL